MACKSSLSFSLEGLHVPEYKREGRKKLVSSVHHVPRWHTCAKANNNIVLNVHHVSGRMHRRNENTNMRRHIHLSRKGLSDPVPADWSIPHPAVCNMSENRE